MSRLTIDVTDQQHQALKAMAALQGKTMKEFAIERLFPPAADEEQAMQDLKALLLTRLGEAEHGGAVNKSATEITEDIFRETGAA